jgi:hypothetical protein
LTGKQWVPTSLLYIIRQIQLVKCIGVVSLSADAATDYHEVDALWTSASNAIDERLFEWQNGEDVDAGIWGPGEPNNKGTKGGKEGCGHIYVREGEGGISEGDVRINDWACRENNGFICEGKPVYEFPNLFPSKKFPRNSSPERVPSK